MTSRSAQRRNASERESIVTEQATERAKAAQAHRW